MAKIEITKTELVWPGKYNEDGTRKEVPRVNLPFQVIETVNESRATREAQLNKPISLFDVYQGKEGDNFAEGWKNKLIWGDNLLVMNSLLERFAGKIDLIYIDPPFATGADFSFKAPIGNLGSIDKSPSIIEEKAYRDTWGLGIDSYLVMFYKRLYIMRELLAPTGSIYVHCDWHVSAFIRLILDEIFGGNNFRNNIIWHYYNKYSAASNCLPRAHDDIFFYSRNRDLILNEVRERRDKAVKQLVRVNVDGVLKNARDDEGNLMYRMSYDKKIDDVWRIPQLQPASSEWSGYATQKHHDLLERIIRLSSNEGDLVADFFCGSGTTLAVAERLGRRWIGCDLGRWGIHITRKRLLGIDDCQPFEVLNLGKYERQYWQGVTFGKDKGSSINERALYEYLAFVLKLYGAQPLPGMTYCHGKKGKAIVYVGAVDAPVTINEIDSTINECVQLKQDDLHVLGWEWEMGLAGPNNDVRRGGLMHDVARRKGVRLSLFQIPREVMEQQAIDKGDIQFFELAYLKAEIEKSDKSTVKVVLKDFVIPNTNLIPNKVRDKIESWSDYIDYWAVDWNFQNDTFIHGWVTYRTRKDRKLVKDSDTHTYERPGSYRILVKVIDIFGNDTSQAYDIEVG